MSRGFYMGDSFDRGYDYDYVEGKTGDWSAMCFLDSSVSNVAATNSVSVETTGISNRLDNIESSLKKVCNSCVNFAANAEEAKEAFKKMAESLNKLGVGVRLCRNNLKTLGGNGRYV